MVLHHRCTCTTLALLILSGVACADSFAAAQQVYLRNLNLENVPKDDPLRTGLNLKILEIDGDLVHASAGPLGTFSTDGSRSRVSTIFYRRATRPKTPNALSADQCEEHAIEFARLLNVPETSMVIRREVQPEAVTFTFRIPGVAGHTIDSTSHLHISRADGVLTFARIAGSYDLSDLKPPRVSGEEAAGIALSEYQRAGMFDITHLSEPILMAGRPMVSDEYRDRVSLDRLNQFQGSKPVSFWRVGFSAHDGASFAGTSHIVEVDAQTGEIVGEVRMSALGGGGDSPALSWPKIGDVAVVGDKSKTVGWVESLVTKDLPGGKPVSVQSGKLIYACRYDAKKNILWRRLPGGKYEPGRPDAKLAKILKSKAR